MAGTRPYANFREFVEKKHGIHYRKALYWIEIYKRLVEAEVPWEKVKNIGWTKLKDLAPVLTKENVDSWVKVAEEQTALQLVETVKAAVAANSPKAIEDQTSKTDHEDLQGPRGPEGDHRGGDRQGKGCGEHHGRHRGAGADLHGLRGCPDHGAAPQADGHRGGPQGTRGRLPHCQDRGRADEVIGESPARSARRPAAGGGMTCCG
jgi:hypothetical protein